MIVCLKKLSNMKYEDQLKSLTPEQKLSLWSKWEKSSLSKESKYRAIYYEAIKKWYLTK